MTKTTEFAGPQVLVYYIDHEGETIMSTYVNYDAMELIKEMEQDMDVNITPSMESSLIYYIRRLT